MVFPKLHQIIVFSGGHYGCKDTSNEVVYGYLKLLLIPYQKKIKTEHDKIVFH
jgi:hypothetical protein